MFEIGFAIALGLIVTLVKCGWPIRMWFLSNPIKVDIIVFSLLMWLHWGTLGGTMGATIGACIVSIILSMGRKLYGYKVRGKYVRGMMDVGHQVRT